ncbi:MAG: cob(I)yrinic acid a,c-diamide adenosyltransferase [Verrucomicrobiia bacterium]
MPRLTKIYTKSGDTGKTGLIGGRRVSKDTVRIWACGTVDEFNSVIGLARAVGASEPCQHKTAGRRLDAVLAVIQNDLLSLGAELATLQKDFRKSTPRIGSKQVVALEKLIDELNAKLGPLEEFILPAGCRTAGALHLARTVCRRAERCCVRLACSEKTGDGVLPYLNRLGDALFVLARWANHIRGISEIYWEKR